MASEGKEAKSGKKRKGAGNQCFRWHLTIWTMTVGHEAIRAWMVQHCDKWGFQQERGEETGRLHWQCVIQLKNRVRRGQLVTMLNEAMLQAHVSPTQKGGGQKAFDYKYATKEATRVMGPWTDEDDAEPRDIKNKSLRPWQATIVEWCKTEPDDRSIDVIYDPHGNIGKTFLVKYLCYHKLADKLPVTAEGKNLNRYAYKAMKDGHKNLVVDMPRSGDMNIRKTREWWMILECIKNGFAEEDRYKATKTIQDPKRLIIFCNNLPERKVCYCGPLPPLTRLRCSLCTVAALPV